MLNTLYYSDIFEYHSFRTMDILMEIDNFSVYLTCAISFIVLIGSKKSYEKTESGKQDDHELDIIEMV